MDPPSAACNTKWKAISTQSKGFSYRNYTEQVCFPLIIIPNSKETIVGQEQQEQIKESMQY